jgi:nitrogen fixation NifU-like protein
MKKSQQAAFKELILDHYKNPRFFARADSVHFSAEEWNRTCGDHVELYLSPDPDSAKAQLSFQGAGCSLCIASASMLCTLLQHQSLAECQGSLQQFQDILTQGAAPDLSELWQAFDALRDYPVRFRCVRLPWQALAKILEQWAEIPVVVKGDS